MAYHDTASGGGPSTPRLLTALVGLVVLALLIHVVLEALPQEIANVARAAISGPFRR